MNHTETNPERVTRVYPVYCAWCQAKGRETVVNMAAAPNSHGICPECREEMRAETRAYCGRRG